MHARQDHLLRVVGPKRGRPKKRYRTIYDLNIAPQTHSPSASQPRSPTTSQPRTHASSASPLQTRPSAASQSRACSPTASQPEPSAQATVSPPIEPSTRVSVSPPPEPPARASISPPVEPPARASVSSPLRERLRGASSKGIIRNTKNNDMGHNDAAQTSLNTGKRDGNSKQSRSRNKKAKRSEITTCQMGQKRKVKRTACMDCRRRKA
ncbi:hypothetical protein BJ508DRAFT_374404 [Ascobolus immersus RN42]|uniref:Uncharacterized protein n=1 Tax=Ascobolus immersus RN42 TaxID=1160509 RepID=A0A3N4IIC3_ASCIM|nr:hypothetical protein BJ508DRAFT_374404 [Ascobolus immersus RN42]